MKKKQPDLGRLGRMMNCYVLVNHKPKRASSLKEWMDFLASPDCIVASTHGASISTLQLNAAPLPK